MLTDQIDEYRTREYQVKQYHPGIEHLRFIDMLPRALIEARVAVGWTQCDLAKHLQVRSQLISRYENNMYARISLARAIEIANLLNKKHGELMAQRAKPSSKEMDPKGTNS